MPTKVMYETDVTETWTLTDAPLIGDKVGDIRWEGNKCYKCVKYVAAATAGQIQKYANAAGYDLSEVRASTSQVEVVAGMCVATALINTIGWVQVKGPATISVNHTGALAVGDSLTPSATSGALALWVTPKQVVGSALDTTNRAMLNCTY